MIEKACNEASATADDCQHKGSAEACAVMHPDDYNVYDTHDIARSLFIAHGGNVNPAVCFNMARQFQQEANRQKEAYYARRHNQLTGGVLPCETGLANRVEPTPFIAGADVYLVPQGGAPAAPELHNHLYATEADRAGIANLAGGVSIETDQAGRTVGVLHVGQAKAD